MKTILALLTLVASLSLSGMLQADEIPRGKVMKIETRGATLPLYAIWKDDAVATVVLYSGGGGGYGRIGEDGWPGAPAT